MSKAPVPDVRWVETDYKHLGHQPVQVLCIGDQKITLLLHEEAPAVNETMKMLAQMGVIRYALPAFDKDYV